MPARMPRRRQRAIVTFLGAGLLSVAAVVGGASGVGSITAIPAAAAAETEPANSVDYYIEALKERFGVQADPDQLRPLLESDWAPIVESWVNLADYGDTVLQPTDVGDKVTEELMDRWVGGISAHGLIPKSTLVSLINSVQSFAEQQDSSHAYKVASSLVSFAKSYGLASSKVFGVLASGMKYANLVLGFQAQVQELTDWGVEAITDRPWREMVIAYQELRSVPGSDEASARHEMETGEFKDYWGPTIAMLTRDLTDDGFWDFVVPDSRFADANDLFDALEMAHSGIDMAQNPEVQERLGVTVDVIAATWEYMRGGTGMRAIQTDDDSITIVNAGQTPIDSVRIESSGIERSSVSEIAAGSSVAMRAPPGRILSGDGLVRFVVFGRDMALPFSEIRTDVWASGLGTYRDSMGTWQYFAVGLVWDPTVPVTWNLDYGDGSFVAAPVGAHRFGCYGEYRAHLTGRVGSSKLVDEWADIHHTGPYTPTIDTGGRTAAEPNTATTFGLNGLPNDDDDLSVNWDFGKWWDAGQVTTTTAADPVVTPSWAFAGIYKVTATVFDKSIPNCAIATTTTWFSVGDKTTWVKLPFGVSGDLRLSTAVAGYWTPEMVVIPEGASLILPAGDQIIPIRASSPYAFRVDGNLELNKVDIAPLTDKSAKGLEDATTVSTDSWMSAVITTGTGSVTIRDSTMHHVSQLVFGQSASAVTFDHVTADDASGGASLSDLDEASITNSSFAGGTALSIGSGKASVVNTQFHAGGVALKATGEGRIDGTGNTFDGGTSVALQGSGWRSTFRYSSGAGYIQLTGAAVAGPTTLSADLPYVPSNAQVPRGTRVLLSAGAVFKVPDDLPHWPSGPVAGFDVSGTLTAAGTADHPVTLTSIYDDSVGGDTDQTGSASQPTGTFVAVGLRDAGIINLDHTIVRHAGIAAAAFNSSCFGCFTTGARYSAGPGLGGTISIGNSDITAGTGILSNVDLASIRTIDSDFHGGGLDLGSYNQGLGPQALIVSGGSVPSISDRVGGRASISHTTTSSISFVSTPDVTITDNTLIDGPDSLSDGEISLVNYSVGATVLRNHVAGSNDTAAVGISGATPPGDVHLSADIPYIASALMVSSDTNLILDPGTVFKVADDVQHWPSGPGTGFDVSGTLTAAGTAAHPVTITSLYDDSIGGDTDQTGSTSQPTGTFVAAGIRGAGTIDLDHTIIKNSGIAAAAFNSSCFGCFTTGATYSAGPGLGGTIAITNSEITAGTGILSNVDLASIRLLDTTFHTGGLALGPNYQGYGPQSLTVTRVSIPSINVTLGQHVSISHTTTSSISIGNTPDVTITDNTLLDRSESPGETHISLTNSSIGATVLRNHVERTDNSGPRDTASVAIGGDAPIGDVHLNADIPYIASVRVNDGTNLILDPGTVFKVADTVPRWPSGPATGFDVSGTLTAAGTTDHPVVITSVFDDSIGGDTDQTGDTVQPSGSFLAVGLRNAGTIKLDHLIVKDAGTAVAAYTSSCYGCFTTGARHSAGPGLGGTITIDNSDITAATGILSNVDLATIETTDTTFRGGGLSLGLGYQDVGPQSVIVSGGSIPTIAIRLGQHVSISHATTAGISVDSTPDVTITDNTLVDSSDSPVDARISLTNGSIGATVLRNHVADSNGTAAVSLSGVTPAGDIHLGADIPYIAALTVGSDTNLILDPGTVFKVEDQTSGSPRIGFAVAGTLTANGTVSEPVTITSIHDDAAGGDTDQTGDSSAPVWAFTAITVGDQAHISLDHTTIKGSSIAIAALYNNCYACNPIGSGVGATIRIADSDITATSGAISTNVNVDSVTSSGSTFRSSGFYFWDSAPTSILNVTGNRFMSDLAGLYMYRGISPANVTITGNDFSHESTGVISTFPVLAAKNWWGSTNGPNADGAATASGAVTAEPWCTNLDCSEFSKLSFSGADGSSLPGPGLDSPRVGAALIAVAPQWSPAATFEFDWKVDGAVVAHGATFTPTPGQVGKNLVLSATGSAAGYKTTTVDTDAGPIASGVLADVRPTIDGDAIVGEILTGRSGWGDVSVTYAWTVRGVTVGTASTYVINPGDVDSRILLTVATNDAAWESQTNTSEPTSVVRKPVFTSTPSPALTGAHVGALLTAVAPEWTPAADFTFDWEIDGSVVSHGPTFRPAASQFGSSLSVVAHGVDRENSANTASVGSTAVPVEAGTITTTIPRIVGSAAVGTTATLDIDPWTPVIEPTIEWRINGKPVATGASYLILEADAGKSLTAVASADLSGYVAVSVESNPAVVSISQFSRTDAPVIAEARVGSIIRVANPTWTPSASFTYTWTVGEHQAATGPEYTPQATDRGKTLTVRATGTALGVATVSTSSAEIVVAPGLFTGAVSITGTPQVDQVITAVPNGFASGATFVYCWMRDGVAIANSATSDYSVTPEDVAHRLSVQVTASLDGYDDAAKTSASSVPVALAAFGTQPIPLVAGIAATDGVLQVLPGLWAPTPDSFSIEWRRNAIPIAGATGPTLTLSPAETDSGVVAVVTAHRLGYADAATSSAPLSISAASLTPSMPTITGTSKIGGVMTAMTGTWSPNPVVLSIQWTRNGSAIPGATSISYTTTSADAGRHIGATVAGSRDGYLTTSASSATITMQKLITIGRVTVTGTARVGKTLHLTTVGWGPSSVKLTYQWKRDGKVIKGASAKSYRLVSSDRKARLTVTVTATKSGYATASKTSKSTGKVAAR